MDLVLECTGKFLAPETIQGHLDGGAKRVVVAAPIRPGTCSTSWWASTNLYDPGRDRIVTAASCTTNCLAPVVKVVHENIGIRRGQITAVHDPTNTNLVVDAPHKDLHGALRMLVLLHFYKPGYSPFTLSFLFLLYEAAGVLANLIGGWLATKFGIARRLTVGLVTQIIGFTLLSMLNPAWTAAMSVAWVVLAQGICGVAKDLTKTASKSAIKITQAEAKNQGSGQLFKWVAWFTGSKNAMKGFGFFLGGLLLQSLGFQGSLWAMAGLLGLVLLGVVSSLPPMMGKSRASRSAKELFAKNRGINALAAARVVLFGARDVWFVVGVPLFLYSAGAVLGQAPLRLRAHKASGGDGDRAHLHAVQRELRKRLARFVLPS